MAITAQLVNELRKKTNIGMMECKKALVACDGDMEAAIEYLRKAGIIKAEEKAGRSANAGIIVAKSNGKSGVLIEFLCETDFVAKTDDFKAFGKHLADIALAYAEDGDICAKLAAETETELKEFIGRLKENMRIRRAIRWNAANGTIAYYLHAATPYGVLAEIEGEYAEELPTQICMHICAINPEYISRDAVPADRIAKEKEIALAQVPADKPDKMKEGIVNGKINKWFATSCLMEQPWVMDDKTTLAKVAPKAKVVRFARWLAGEDVAEENA